MTGKQGRLSLCVNVLGGVVVVAAVVVVAVVVAGLFLAGLFALIG